MPVVGCVLGARFRRRLSKFLRFLAVTGVTISAVVNDNKLTE